MAAWAKDWTRLALLVVVLICLSDRPTAAELIKFTFGGEVDLVIGDVPGPWTTVTEGSAFEMSYIFDSEAEDQDNSDNWGRYDLISAEVTMEDAAQQSNDGWIRIDVDHQWYWVSISDLPIGGDAAISMYAFPGTFETDALPLDLDLDDFYPSARSFEVIQSGGGWEIHGDITSFSSQIVPAPGAIVLPGAVFLMSGGARRRGRVNTRRGVHGEARG